MISPHSFPKTVIFGSSQECRNTWGSIVLAKPGLFQVREGRSGRQCVLPGMKWYSVGLSIHLAVPDCGNAAQLFLYGYITLPPASGFASVPVLSRFLPLLWDALMGFDFSFCCWGFSSFIDFKIGKSGDGRSNCKVTFLSRNADCSEMLNLNWCLNSNFFFFFVGTSK